MQFLLLGGKARALLNGRTYVSTDDVASLAAPVLRHRVVTNFSAESEGRDAGPRDRTAGRVRPLPKKAT